MKKKKKEQQDDFVKKENGERGDSSSTTARGAHARLRTLGRRTLPVALRARLLRTLHAGLAARGTARTAHLDALDARDLEALRHDAHRLEHGAGLGVDLDLLDRNLRHVGDVVVTTLTLLLLLSRKKNNRENECSF